MPLKEKKQNLDMDQLWFYFAKSGPLMDETQKMYCTLLLSVVNRLDLLSEAITDLGTSIERLETKKP
jgi:hypothetical protein